MLRGMAFAGAALVVAAALVGVACSGGGGEGGGAPPDGVELMRTAEADGVSVDATWLTAETLDGVEADLAAYPVSEFVLVEVAFTTHSGDLTQIDMEQATALSWDGADQRPVAWLSLSDDSHHRAGVLVFERTATEGAVELTLEISEEQMVLRWESVPSV